MCPAQNAPTSTTAPTAGLAATATGTRCVTSAPETAPPMEFTPVRPVTVGPAVTTVSVSPCHDVECVTLLAMWSVSPCSRCRVCHLGHDVECVTMVTMWSLSPWSRCGVRHPGHDAECYPGNDVECVTLVTMWSVSPW